MNLMRYLGRYIEPLPRPPISMPPHAFPFFSLVPSSTSASLCIKRVKSKTAQKSGIDVVDKKRLLSKSMKQSFYGG
jgi:hypothetical protein